MKRTNIAVLEFDPRNPNASLDLDQFDYNELTHKNWKAYHEMIDTLSPVLGITENTNRLFDFIQVRAVPVYEERYPGIPNTPRDLVGITLKIAPSTNTAVVNQTRITISQARHLNSQIENEHARAGHGRFYLLKNNQNL